MNTAENETPLYNKAAHFMIAVIGVLFILNKGADVILPLLFSALFAILLNPAVSFLHKKRLPRLLAIFIVMLISMLLISALIFMLVSQISQFSNMLPQLKIQLNTAIQQSIQWLSAHYHISAEKSEEWLYKSMNNGIENATSAIGQTLMSISGAVFVLFLIPVYVFMILYYKPLILEFISKLFAKNNHQNIEVILSDSKSLIQSYLIGLLIELIIVSVLNIIGLLIIGVEFAVLLGVTGALLNIIPYIGGVVAVILTMIIALTTQSANAAFWVFIAYIIVQFTDNNIIMPYVVASKVKLNALASIIVVLIGSAIWGIPGMFLSIPLTAILKVIFDRFDSLKPYGLLLGDTMSSNQNFLFIKLNFPKSK